MPPTATRTAAPAPAYPSCNEPLADPNNHDHRHQSEKQPVRSNNRPAATPQPDVVPHHVGKIDGSNTKETMGVIRRRATRASAARSAPPTGRPTTSPR